MGQFQLLVQPSDDNAGVFFMSGSHWSNTPNSCKSVVNEIFCLKSAPFRMCLLNPEMI